MATRKKVARHQDVCLKLDVAPTRSSLRSSQAPVKQAAFDAYYVPIYHAMAARCEATYHPGFMGERIMGERNRVAVSIQDVRAPLLARSVIAASIPSEDVAWIVLLTFAFCA